MATFHAITSADDPRVADYRTVKDSALRKRYEHEVGVFIAEGPHAVRELLSSAYDTRDLLLSPQAADRLGDVLADRDVEVLLADRDLLREIVRFDLHQGAIGCGRRRPLPPLAQVLEGSRTALVLEGLNDHENLGTLFRSARGLGVDAVLLGPRCADPLYRRSVRVSMGHVLHVPFTQVDDVAEVLPRLHQDGWTSVALTPDPAAVALDAVGPPGPVALLLGAEGPGLDPSTMRAAHIRARIPMAADVDSLNVGVAGAIAAYALVTARTRPRVED